MDSQQNMDFAHIALMLGYITTDHISEYWENSQKGQKKTMAEWLLARQYIDNEQQLAVYKMMRQQSDLKDPEKNNQTVTLAHSFVGRYQLLEQIGKGGSGRVYKSYDCNLGRLVALKALISLAPGEVQRFLREAKTIAQLHHPNIIAIHDVGEEKGTVFFVMDFVAGGSLEDRLRQKLPSLSQVVDIMSKLADAMQCAHKQGIIHRDLKPSNILLESNLEPKISDFGLAKWIDQLKSQSGSGVVMGTPQYMPPEQAEARSEEVDAQSDVYSLGAIMYEMIGGRPPFCEGNSLNILYQVANDKPKPLSQLRANVPRELEEICNKAMEKQKKRRYLTAQEMLDDLRAVVLSKAGKSATARHSFAGRKKSVPAWAIAGAVSLFLALTALFFLGDNKNDRKAGRPDNEAIAKKNIRQENDKPEPAQTAQPVQKEPARPPEAPAADAGMRITNFLTLPLAEADEGRQMRAKIDQRIADRLAQNRPATLGLLIDAIDLTISFGAPVYNEGRHQTCYEFYWDTCHSLSASFVKPELATPLGGQGLDILRAAMQRCGIFPGASDKAWALRFGFDHVKLLWQTQSLYLRDLGLLAGQAAQTIRYRDAEYGFSQATRLLDEIATQYGNLSDPRIRLVPLAWSASLLVQKKFDEAGQALEQALVYAPDLPQKPQQALEFHTYMRDYKPALIVLQQQAQQNPRDVQLLFLLACHYHWNGRQQDAQILYRQILAQEPAHSGARKFFKGN